MGPAAPPEGGAGLGSTAVPSRGARWWQAFATLPLAVLGVAVWWSGRGLAGDDARSWLAIWDEPENFGAVRLALSVALAVAVSAGASYHWVRRTPWTPREVLRSCVSTGWLGALPLVLLFRDPTSRAIVAAAYTAALPWLLRVPHTRTSWGRDEQTAAAGTTTAARRLAMAVGARAHLAAAIASAAYLGVQATRRHAAHWSSLIDLGLFYELFDNPSGRLLYAPTLGFSFLGEHFSPLLVVLAPLVWLVNSPVTLLWIQVAAIAVAGLLLRRLCLARTSDRGLAFALMVAWFLNPWVQQAALYDFHMDMLEPMLVFGAAIAAVQRRNVILWVCCIALWMTKEDTFIYTSLIALWVLFGQRRTAVGGVLLGVGLLQAFVVIGHVLPDMRPPHDPGFFSTAPNQDGYAFIGRYDHLGEGFREIGRKVLLNPFAALAHTLTGPRLACAAGLVISFGWMAIPGRWNLLLLLPAAEMLLANPGRMSQFEFYYGAVVLPFAAIAAVEGSRALLLGRPEQSRATARRRAIAAIAWATLVMVAVHPASRLAPENKYQDYVRTDRHERIDSLLSVIPDGARVAATGYDAVRIQRGRRVTMLPYGVDDADWVAVDFQRPAWPTDFTAVLSTVRRLLRSGDWEVAAFDTEFYLLRRREGAAERQVGTTGTVSGSAMEFEAELTELTHFRGRYAADPGASNGRCLSAPAHDSRGPGHLVWGPYMPLDAGSYKVTFRLRWRPGGRTAEEGTTVATLDVRCDSGGVVSARPLVVADFSSVAWADYDLEFELEQPDSRCEGRVYYHDRGTLDLDRVRWAVSSEPPD